MIYESSVKPDFNYLIKQNGPCLGFIISRENQKKIFFSRMQRKKIDSRFYKQVSWQSERLQIHHLLKKHLFLLEGETYSTDAYNAQTNHCVSSSPSFIVIIL